MSHCHPSPSDSPELNRLVDFVHCLDASAHPAPLPVVAGVDFCASSEVDLFVSPPADCVYDSLLCLAAPAHWDAVVAWTHGDAFLPDRPQRPDTVTILVGVARDGGTISRVWSSDGAVLCGNVGEPCEGLLVDCARRAFRHDTPPPPPTTAQLHAAIWLDRVLAATLAQGAKALSWPEVAALHPASADTIAMTPAAIATASERLAQAGAWGALRRAAARHEKPELPVSPAAAAWMDDGLFARWCLAVLLEPSAAATELEAVLAPGVADAMREVLRGSR